MLVTLWNCNGLCNVDKMKQYLHVVYLLKRNVMLLDYKRNIEKMNLLIGINIYGKVKLITIIMTVRQHV